MKVDETMEEWLQNLYANKPRFTKTSTNKLAQIKNSAPGLFNRFNPAKADPFTQNFGTHPIQSQNAQLLQTSKGKIGFYWNFSV